MLPAVDLDAILDRAHSLSNRGPLADRLVSVVFAPPGSFVWKDLHANRALLDGLSGDEWDLFFAGISGFGRDLRSRVFRPVQSRMAGSNFNVDLFLDLVGEVQEGHAEAVAEADLSLGPAWRYDGGTWLVSFMVYGRRPDWASLKPYKLDSGAPLELSEVTQRLVRWADGDSDPDLSPGEFAVVNTPRYVLAGALMRTTRELGISVAGSAAYDALKSVLG